MKHSIPITALLVVGATASCAGDAGLRRNETIRDFVTTDTVLVVGADDARPGHALHQIRSAVREPSGRLFLADGSSGEARVYDERGDLLATLGRRGAGPGEHRVLSWVRPVLEDTVETYDGGSRRLTYWSPAWTVARYHQFADPEYTPVAPAGAETFLAIRFDRATSFPSGTSRTDTVFMSLIRVGGGTPVELSALPYETRFAATLPTGGVIYTPLPLEPKAAFAAGRSTVYFGYPASGVVRRFDLEGVELPPIMFEAPRQPLTGEARTAWQRPLVDGMPLDQQQAMREYLDRLPYSDSLPVFDTIVVDDLERVWVRLFPVPGQEVASWRVFEAEREIGRVQIRADQRLLDVGSDYAVVGDTRADGAEVVVSCVYSNSGSGPSGRPTDIRSLDHQGSPRD